MHVLSPLSIVHGTVSLSTGQCPCPRGSAIVHGTVPLSTGQCPCPRDSAIVTGTVPLSTGQCHCLVSCVDFILFLQGPVEQRPLSQARDQGQVQHIYYIDTSRYGILTSFRHSWSGFNRIYSTYCPYFNTFLKLTQKNNSVCGHNMLKPSNVEVK